jgi:hypothetical protein
MTTRTTLLVLWLVSALGAVQLLAQAPDLSGTWRLNKSASQITMGAGLAGLDRGGAPNTIYVTQAANGTLTIGSDHNQGLARAYMVGGESAIPAAPSGTVAVRTRWEGRTLVVESTTATAGAIGALKELLAISADGQTLNVTVTTSAADGPKTTTLVYTRTQVEAPCKSWPTPCR